MPEVHFWGRLGTDFEGYLANTDGQIQRKSEEFFENTKIFCIFAARIK